MREHRPLQPVVSWSGSSINRTPALMETPSDAIAFSLRIVGSVSALVIRNCFLAQRICVFRVVFRHSFHIIRDMDICLTPQEEARFRASLLLDLLGTLTLLIPSNGKEYTAVTSKIIPKLVNHENSSNSYFTEKVFVLA